MRTDWLLFRRLAAEIDRRVRGARITAAGLLPDGRFALRFAKGESLVADPFAESPLVLLARDAETPRPLAWTRPFEAALAGMRVARVAARRGDRLIAVDVASRSRFGVEARLRLVFELVPRFGNVLLLKDDAIVAAAREFDRSKNPRRPIEAGGPYEPPPLPVATLDDAGFLRAVGESKALGAAIRARFALVPHVVAESFAAAAGRLEWPGPEALARYLGERATAVLAATEGEPDALGPVYVYDRDGRPFAAHVVRLEQYAGNRERTAPELAPVLATIADADRVETDERALEVLRERLALRVRLRYEAVERERTLLASRLADDDARERLRRCGETLYAFAGDAGAGAERFVSEHAPDLTIELDPAIDARANAARYFARYRKATAERPYLAARLEAAEAECARFEELTFAIERADAGALRDVASEIDDERGNRERRPAAALAPDEIALGGDARVLAGRSPRGNADLTFRIARPGDLWFHARGVPGAHVVLKIDAARAPSADEISAAAQVAAERSRARDATTVDVDYTQRKHVRKRRGAAPGLVWYTHASTVAVRPREPSERG